MSNNLFDPRYEKRIIPRTYYKATASNGAVALRGSHRDMYDYACIRVEVETEILYDNQLTWASFHRTKELAQRICNSANKHTQNGSYEVVQLERISAQEHNRLRREYNKSRKKYWSEKNKETMLEFLANEVLDEGGD